MGTAGAKAFGDMLLSNKTLQTLDVSDNSFGEPTEGEQVKLNSGEMCTLIGFDISQGIRGTKQDGGYQTWTKEYQQEYQWENQVPALCAGVAASPSLISVSTTFRHALAVSISHSSPYFYHVRSSMLPGTNWVQRAERPSRRP